MGHDDNYNYNRCEPLFTPHFTNCKVYNDQQLDTFFSYDSITDFCAKSKIQIPFHIAEHSGKYSPLIPVFPVAQRCYSYSFLTYAFVGRTITMRYATTSHLAILPPSRNPLYISTIQPISIQRFYIACNIYLH